MRIAVIGSGYVGLVAATCLSDFGHFVVSIDKDEAKIARLRQGEIPIYEPGLAEIVARNVLEGRLSFTTSMMDGIKDATVIFIGVGTPPRPDGTADLTQVETVVKEIGEF